MAIEPVDVAIAIAETAQADAERARTHRELGILELSNLVDVYGAACVERWLRNITASVSPGTIRDPRR